MAVTSSLLLLALAGCAALAALVAAPADAAPLVASEGDLLDNAATRAKRQLTRYDDEDDDVDEDDWETRAKLAVARYQNAVRSGLYPQEGSEEQQETTRTGNNNNNNRNRQNSARTASQQTQGRTRSTNSNGNSNPSARQTSNGYRPTYGGATSTTTTSNNADPSTRSSWGNGADSDGANGNVYGSNGNGVYGNNGVFGGDSSSGGAGGLFGGSGLFGNRPSIIGGLIRRLGQGFANTVQGVSSALANKWTTKAQAARAFASSLFNTGRVGFNSGLQAGLAHPRFAVEAMENVF